MVKQGLPGLRCRYAVNVIDRADGQIKVLEGSGQLFLEFRRCSELTGLDLGVADAFDISIAVAGRAGEMSYRVSFNPDKRTPFTSAEKDKIRAGMFHLPTLFAPS